MAKENNPIVKDYQIDTTSMDRPYDNMLNRSETTDTDAVAVNPTDTTGNDGTDNGSTGSVGSNSDVNGSVQNSAVKSDGALSDVYISTFIRSPNWSPKTRGFTINGNTGYAEFSNVYVSGNIQALSGLIGGFTIGATDLSATSGGNTTKLSSGAIAFSAGPTGAPTVTITQAGVLTASGAVISGTLTATTGFIGGWTIGSTSLSDTSGLTGMSSAITAGDDIRFWAGHATPSSAPFRVTEAGVITATSGTIGGWTLGSTTLSATGISLDAGNFRISVGSSGEILIDGANKKIESSNYVSGVFGSGFHIDSNLLEVGNISARGLIRTAVFQKDVVSVVGGNLAVLDGDVLNTNMTALDSSTITTKGNTTFTVGDILRIKDGIDDEWMEVTNAGSAPIYTVTRDKAAAYSSNNNPTWKMGATIVNYRKSGDGGVYITASESNAPYLSIFDHAGSPWTTTTTRLRLGNLNGYLGYSSNLYGIGIGEATKYLKYDPTNGLRIKGTITIDNPSDINTNTLTNGAGWTTDAVANTKKRNFTSTPTTPYEIGDLWSGGSSADIKVCTNTRLTGAYVAGDWVLASKYTDNTVANSKVTTFLQAGIPTSLSVGDIWIDTDDNNKMYRAAVVGATTIAVGQWEVVELAGGAKIFAQASIPVSIAVNDLWYDTDDGNKLYKADSIGASHIAVGEWVEISDQNKTTTFAQDGIPTSTAVGDFWVDTNDENKLYRASSIGADAIAAGEWVLVRDSGIATAIQDAADAQSTADGKVITFAQNGIPVSEGIGDLWIDTNDGNKLYRAAIAGADAIIAGEWEPFRDTTIADAQATADGKIVSFFQNGIPVSEGVGDLWFDTDDGNKSYRAESIGADQIAAGEWVAVPTDFANVNGTTKPENNATVGATWGTNLSNIPATLGAPSGTGLFLSSTNMGYYTGGAWKTYMDSSGNMVLGDISGGNTGMSWSQGAGTLTIKGAITADTGYLGGSTGWTIATGYLKKDTGVELTSAGMAPLDYPFYAGAQYANRATAPFRVSNAGVLNATGATISGAITATTGTIGSFTIGTYLYTGTKTAYNDANAGIHLGSDGIGIANNLFTVSAAGALTAKSATIGNWSVNTTSIYTGTEDHSGYTGAAGDITLYSNGTDASIHGYNFYIDTSGNLTATSVTVTGALTTGVGSSINGTYIDSLVANKITAGTGIINNLSILSTLTMGSGSGDGYIQSYGWNGSANGFQIKGGNTPSISVIGGSIAGSTVTGSTLSTATSGQRTVLNATTQTFYNSSDIQVGTIYATTADSGGLLISGVQSGSNLFLFSGSAGSVTIGRSVSTGCTFNGSDFYPGTSGSFDLGNTSYKWKDIWAVGSFVYNGIDQPRMYDGYVSGSSVTGGNSSFSSNNSGTGIYTITHNLGTNAYNVMLTAYNTTGYSGTITNISTNSFSVRMINLATSSAANSSFMFLLMLETTPS